MQKGQKKIKLLTFYQKLFKKSTENDAAQIKKAQNTTKTMSFHP